MKGAGLWLGVAEAGQLRRASRLRSRRLGEVGDAAHPALSVLAQCYIAEDLGAFLEFWKANPHLCVPRRRHAKG